MNNATIFFSFFGGFFVSQIECLRQKLYKEIESGSPDMVLHISQQLDELILYYTVNALYLSKKSA